MIKLIKNCDVYAPKHLGKNDILIVGGKIAKIAPDLSAYEKECQYCGEVSDVNGSVTCPGIIDMHVHITGGGGEQGPSSRTPEIKLTDLTLSGVTTVLGLLGTDGISRSLENLLFKCSELNSYGLTVNILTGNYAYPTVTFTGSVARDISLINEVLGVKVAVSDHRSSNITGDELIRLATEVRVSAMLSGKAGIVTMHMGSGKAGLAPIFHALENSDVPINTFLPTHSARTPSLLADAVRFNKMGGTIDITAYSLGSEKGAAALVSNALAQGADPTRITFSSDGCGSMPRFDAEGKCIGLTYSTPITLLGELKRLCTNENMSLEAALPFFTENPARVLGYENTKGCIKENADGDILVLNENLAVKELFANGKHMVKNGKAIVKGTFEL